MTPEEQENFIGVFKAMGAGDGTRAARHLLRFSAEQSPHVDREVLSLLPY